MKVFRTTPKNPCLSANTKSTSLSVKQGVSKYANFRRGRSDRVSDNDTRDHSRLCSDSGRSRRSRISRNPFRAQILVGRKSMSLHPIFADILKPFAPKEGQHTGLVIPN